MKGHICSVIKNRRCDHAINKYYSYGFMSGMSGYCKKVMKWTHNINNCPLKKLSVRNKT